jgi:copper chaperone CopZ
MMSHSRTNLSVTGTWEVKRHFTLPAVIHKRDAQVISERLGNLPGVHGTETNVHRHRVTVVYDITLVDYRHLLDALAETGFPAPETWWSRLKTYWFQSLDETGRENANAPAAPCCSNPRGIARTKK